MSIIKNNEFIFSVKEIFTTFMENKDGFYIAPYQRGYKWGIYAKVMLHDILNASEKNNDKFYYLNFISIKSTEIKGNNYIELIDGQQRITTLVLFWSIVFKMKKELNIDLSKSYDGINNDLTDCLVFGKQKSETISMILDLNTKLSDTQDNYYLRAAVYEIINFLQYLQKENFSFQKYLNYFSNQVKIITNEEKKEVSA
ncbi:MAG: DUF262 domain-containing protein, partial [Ignavibacteria bacterium]